MTLSCAWLTTVVVTGGMGIRISSHTLARQVSRMGELGVVSGTAIDAVFVRVLQSGKSSSYVATCLKKEVVSD